MTEDAPFSLLGLVFAFDITNSDFTAAGMLSAIAAAEPLQALIPPRSKEASSIAIFIDWCRVSGIELRCEAVVRYPSES
jgi:hypothetical protein